MDNENWIIISLLVMSGISVSNSQIGPDVIRGLIRSDITYFPQHRQIGQATNTDVSQSQWSLRNRSSFTSATVNSADTPNNIQNAQLQYFQKKEQEAQSVLQQDSPRRTVHTLQLKNTTPPAALVSSLRALMQNLANRNNNNANNANMPIISTNRFNDKDTGNVRETPGNTVQRIVIPHTPMMVSLTDFIQSRDKPPAKHVPLMRKHISNQEQTPVIRFQNPMGTGTDRKWKRAHIPHLKQDINVNRQSRKRITPHQHTIITVSNSNQMNIAGAYKENNEALHKPIHEQTGTPMALFVLSDERAPKHTPNAKLSHVSRVSPRNGIHSDVATHQNIAPTKHHATNVHTDIHMSNEHVPFIHIRQVPSRTEHVQNTNTRSKATQTIPSNTRLVSRGNHMMTGRVEPRNYPRAFWGIFDQLLRDVNSLVRLELKDTKRNSVRTRHVADRGVNGDWNSSNKVKNKNPVSYSDSTFTVLNNHAPHPLQAEIVTGMDELPAVNTAITLPKTLSAEAKPAKSHGKRTNLLRNKGSNKLRVRDRFQSASATKPVYKRTYTIVERLSGNVINVADGRAVLKSNDKPTVTLKTPAKKKEVRLRNSRLQPVRNSRPRKKEQVTNSHSQHGSIFDEYQHAASVNAIPPADILKEYGRSVLGAVNPALDNEHIRSQHKPRAIIKHDVHNTEDVITQAAGENKTNTRVERVDKTLVNVTTTEATIIGQITETSTTAIVSSTTHLPKHNLPPHNLVMSSTIGTIDGPTRSQHKPRALAKHDVHNTESVITQVAGENKTSTRVERVNKKLVNVTTTEATIIGQITETTTTANVSSTTHHILPQNRVMDNTIGTIDDPTHLTREETRITENETAHTVPGTRVVALLFDNVALTNTGVHTSGNVSMKNTTILTNNTNNVSKVIVVATTITQPQTTTSKPTTSTIASVGVTTTVDKGNEQVTNITQVVTSTTAMPINTTETRTTIATSTIKTTTKGTPLDKSPVARVIASTTPLTTLPPTPRLIASTTPLTTLPPTPRPDPLPAIFQGQHGFRLRESGFHLFHSSSAAEQLNITYLNDDHVCPASRAVWKDYTVYLEVKQRQCMIQVTWNARYKREPLYTGGGWWGGNTEYTYRTVYDPEVRFVDLNYWYK